MGREIAQVYPDIAFTDIIVDNCAMQLVRDPTRFDVIVTTNLFGDILSDLTAGLVGGLGLVAGANIGEGPRSSRRSHGTAPTSPARDRQPSRGHPRGAMMLERLGHKERWDSGGECSAARYPLGKDLTPDLGGTGNTERFTDRVIEAL